MKQQFQTLLEQARAESSQWTGSRPGITLTYDTLTQFAELIVQECVSICKEKERPNLYGVREVEAGIKQHFGVLE